MLTALQYWVEMLREVRLPVLARTVAELERLSRDERVATPQAIAAIVLHDPIMTVKVLQYLQQHRNRHRSADITTIAHALMMLGISPFLAHFHEQSTIEGRLTADTAALHGVRQVMSRARHGALYAHDWARLRHDIDPEEIMVAALLHDLAEVMLWCFAPALAIEIAERQRADRTLRSEDVQREVIGFRLLDLQMELIAVWQLPPLLRVLMDDARMNNPRVRNVALAAAVARHSAHGWDNLALPYDFELAGELLGQSRDDVAERVAKVAAQAAGDWEWYGIRLPACPPSGEIGASLFRH
jgi:HD-like signal output (HDOD) protein